MPLVQGRKRRAEVEDDESPDESPEPQTQRRRVQPPLDDEDENSGVDGGATQSDGLDDMVKKLVRLALACEYQRKPIRRIDISEKVLGSTGRQFKIVFNAAQVQLQAVLGMQMVELPAKEKTTLQQRRAAQKTPSQAKATTSWALCSTLPSVFRDPNIIQPPAAPTSADESKFTGIYTLLVSLIMLSGGRLPDSKMNRSLERLMIQDKTPVRDYEKTENLLKKLERDGYVMKIRESTGTGEDDIYWIVGSRGKVEVGEDGVRGLTKAVFGDMEADAEEELERKIARSLGIMDRPVERQAAREIGRRKRGRKEQAAEDEQVNGEDEEDEEQDDDDDD